MRNKKGLLGVVLLGLLLLPAAASAQNSSLNAYSPYSFYGLGDFSVQGTANLRAMGGAGIAYRKGTTINYMNPAAFSSIRQKSALFNVGLEGQNFYLKTTDNKSSFNTFNVRDIAFAVPLAAKLGLGVSVTPLSSVGYRIDRSDTDPDIGQLNYSYSGEGDVVQAKLSVGYELAKNLSVGAELVYYFGSIDRYSLLSITELNPNTYYKDVTLAIEESYSKFVPSFGVQYVVPLKKNRRSLTIGAVFQPEVKLSPKITKSIPTSDNSNDFGDYILQLEYKNNDLTMPMSISGGLFYQTDKISLGADYVFQNWGGANKKTASDSYRFRNTNIVRGGVEYTPDRGDVRHFFNRVTYRAGFRYSDYYMNIYGKNISDKAITLGIGLPIKMTGFSNIDLGFELGQRGTTKYNLIKENYFRFSIGLSLFGDDFWFVKPKFD